MSLSKLAKAGFVSVLCIFFSINSYAQPTANFTANTTAGCGPLVVNFTDQSTGNPTSWSWNFGDPRQQTLVTGQNPSWSFFNPGQYTVTLTVTNASGSNTKVMTQYITVYAKPTINFSATPNAGCPPLNAVFTNLSTAGSGTIASLQWSFGEGSTDTSTSPSHIYTSTGSYNPSLIVTNSFGCRASLTKDSLINITTKPNASFTIGSTANCGAPLTVSFTNQSTGTGTLTYLWIFGDGRPNSTLENPSHTYMTTGVFSPKLIVFNQSGCSDTIVRPNSINIANNLTMFTAPTTVCANTNVSITNSTTPAPVNTIWSFGDSTTSTNFTPVKTYTTPGTYEIKMINNYGVCMDSMVRTITVLEQPVANFGTTSPRSSCMAPFTVHFSDSSTNAVSYSWNFGDNTPLSTSQNPTHTYTRQGSYTVTLTVTAANGCTSTKTMSDYVVILLPVISVNQLPQSGCAPFEWTFVHTVYGGDSIVSYQWNFGDGSPISTLQSPTHVFDSGAYTITLIVTTSEGCRDTVTYVNGIKAGVRPNAAFTASPRITCAQIPVAFTDQSTPIGALTQWHWDFGDGAVSTAQNPQHVFTDTGYFDIEFIAYNNGCSDTLVLQNYVYINPPIAKFIIRSNCSNRSRREFIDSSIGADTWAWNFGDGTPNSNLQNPVHDYTSSGIYTVSLTVHNNLTGCDYTKTMITKVVIPNVIISASLRVLCRGEVLTLTALNLSPSLYSLIKWNIGTNGMAPGIFTPYLPPVQNNPFTVTLNAPGIYSVTLITVDINGCRDTIYLPNYITVNGPTASFRVTSNTSICSSASVCFSDSSITDGRNGLAYWIWNFGDGQTDTTRSRSICHVYNTGGVFNITVTAVDSSGCRNSFTRPGLVTVYHPSASFNTFDTISCPQHAVTFNNTSTGSGLTYVWNFGDGGRDTVPNPSHIYRRSGQYTVTLIAYDNHGCSDTAVMTNVVHIVTPQANFTMSDTLALCPPLVVNFTNTSVNYLTYSWNFGTTGGTSSLLNPSFTYTVADTFHVALTVTGPGGCVSVKRKNIVVKGPRGTFTYGGLSGCVPSTVNFTATTQDAANFVWDYRDGNIDSTSISTSSHPYTQPGSYVPQLILSDTAGCVVPLTGTDTIRIYDITSGFNFNTPTLCDNGTVLFNNTTTAADAITGYTWNFGDSTTSTSANPSHNYNGQGLYYPQLIATSLHGCRDTLRSTIPVKVVSSPQGAIQQSANGCVNLTVNFSGLLTVQDTSSVTWNWDFGNPVHSTLMTPPSQIYNVAGNYPITLLVTNSSGCKDTVRSVVEAYAIPTIDAGIDTMICKGRGATLQATGGSTYVWTPSTGLSCTNCASPVANPANPVQYFVTGTSIHGCINRDSIKVSVKYPFAMTASRKDSLCMGSSLRISANGAYTYVWSPSTGLDNPSSASPMASPSTTTTYQVIGTDDKGCFKDTAYVPVIVFDIPRVEAGADRTINVGQSIDLIPQVSADVIDARWSPTGSIFRDIFPGVTVKPNATTTYTVLVTNRGGCTASDQLTVNVLCNGANMFIPNTFSPNGDGMNDLFYPRGSGIFTIKSIKIFSRWGEIIFEKNNFNANDASKAWDGTFKGKKLNSDVFVYMVEVVCDNNEKLVFKGNVALIK
jgi:gliding motility-associated-like protein